MGYSILILIAFHVEIILALKPKEFCVFPSNMYQEARCKHHQCRQEICSTDKNKCDLLVDWTSLLDLKMSFVPESLKKYENFVIHIKNCSSKELVLMKNEACLNKKVCFERKSWSSRLMFEAITVFEKKKCPCKGKFGFDCRNSYCAVNKQTCQDLFAVNIYKDIIKEIKSCQ